jgi:hypothetical protein
VRTETRKERRKLNGPFLESTNKGENDQYLASSGIPLHIEFFHLVQGDGDTLDQ